MEIRIHSLSEVNGVARRLIEFAERQSKKIFFLYGELGAGKTTLVRELCSVLGSEDVVNSPTFSLINEYCFVDEKGVLQPIYHMDLYRLNSLAEAYNIGVEEYLQSGSWCFVEWPEVLEGMLTEGVLEVYLTEETDSMRKIVLL